jgi:hypothetical protein
VFSIFSSLNKIIFYFTGSRGNNDYYSKYRVDIPVSEQDEEEMLRIALELSKSELSKEDKNNNKETDSKKDKEDQNFSVKVSADYGAEVPSESNAGDRCFTGLPSQGTTRDVDEFSTYDNCESDDNQDTMSWYDNIGGLSDNSVYSPMPEVHKTYYSNKHGRDHPKAATGSRSHGSSRKSGLSNSHSAGARDTEHGDFGRRRTNLRHGMGDDIRHDVRNHQNLHVPRSSKADKGKGSHHKH